MNTPSITGAQIVAIAQALIGAAVAFGAPITQAQSVALLALVGVIAHVLVKGDATIREARNYRAASDAESSVESNPPTGYDGAGEPLPDDEDAE